MGTKYDPRSQLNEYEYPNINLLEDESYLGAVTDDEINFNKKRITDVLASHLINIESIKATTGSTFTLFEVIPVPGIRISKIKNLADDIALSLSALGIRIIAPMPGKGTIGIEVPNKEPKPVSLKSLLASKKFKDSDYDLPIAIGKDTINEIYILDLATLPHILMAGATGQGKSIGLNVILLSLMFCKHPSEVKFVLIDPKKVELTLFSKVERHFLAKLPDLNRAIVTGIEDSVRTINSLLNEMDIRYDLLNEAQVRSIKEYNEKFISRKLNINEGHRYLPYLVVVIDEFADLMLNASKQIERPLSRLAQMSRATGIHLILATQRPSVNIITGTIKANFPTRFSFRVASKVDSRTILDTGGAERLIGRGDLLISLGPELTRVQCAFVGTEEIDRVTEFIGLQKSFPDSYYLPGDKDSELYEYDSQDWNNLLNKAILLFYRYSDLNVRLLQNELRINFADSKRILDHLEQLGIAVYNSDNECYNSKLIDG